MKAILTHSIFDELGFYIKYFPLLFQNALYLLFKTYISYCGFRTFGQNTPYVDFASKTIFTSY